MRLRNEKQNDPPFNRLIKIHVLPCLIRSTIGINTTLKLGYRALDRF
jgi:hypothetical protein